jgi:hypothetical protein
MLTTQNGTRRSVSPSAAYTGPRLPLEGFRGGLFFVLCVCGSKQAGVAPTLLA